MYTTTGAGAMDVGTVNSRTSRGNSGSRARHEAAEPRPLERRLARPSRRCMVFAAKEATTGLAKRDIRLRSRTVPRRVLVEANHQVSWRSIDGGDSSRGCRGTTSPGTGPVCPRAHWRRGARRRGTRTPLDPLPDTENTDGGHHGPAR